jgi:hypothetical protein
MPGKFVVGSDDGAIGTAVRHREGFRFTAAHEDFAALNGRVFRRARSLVNEVARHAQLMRRSQASSPRGGTALW